MQKKRHGESRRSRCGVIAGLMLLQAVCPLIGATNAGKAQPVQTAVPASNKLAKLHRQRKEFGRLMLEQKNESESATSETTKPEVPVIINQLPGYALNEKENEAKELLLDTLASVIDRAQTTFGFCRIGDSLRPTKDLKEILSRQETVKSLLADQTLFNRLMQQLQIVSDTEDAWFGYNVRVKQEDDGRMSLTGDPKQGYSCNPLFSHAEGLYYGFPPIKRIRKNLNENLLALEGGALIDIGKAGLQAAGFIGVSQVMSQLFNPLFGNNCNIDLKKILTGSLSQFSVFAPILPNPYKKPERNTSEADIAFDQRKKEWAANHDWADEKLGFHNRARVMLDPQAPTEGTRYSVRLSDKWKWEGKSPFGGGIERLRLKRDDSTSTKAMKWATAYGMTAATAAAIFYVSIYQPMGVLAGTKRLLYDVMNALRNHMKRVARSMRAIEDLVSQVRAAGDMLPDKALREAADRAHAVLNLPKVKKLRELLRADTFKGSAKLFYRRGNVLLAHRTACQVAEQLRPLFAFVGEVDAYCGMASFYEEHRTKENKVCFVDFAEDQTPVIDLQQFWLPVLEAEDAKLQDGTVVTNSFRVGGGSPVNALFTGPNGGGKSTVIKGLGQAVVLAQSWGIAPASAMRMTLLDGLCTCIDPHEDLVHGWSKFLASMEGMKRIEEFLKLHRGARSVLVLADEPYSGTVDDVMRENTSKLCDAVAGQGNAMSVIATHVKPDISKPDRFGFFHVGILDNPDGTFRRTFRIEPGLCNWWFNDKQRRGRYIDWIHGLDLGKTLQDRK